MKMLNRSNTPVRVSTVLAVLCASLTCAADEKTAAVPAANESPKAVAEGQSVVLRLMEEAEVPAQEAGVVTGVAVREGQRVKQGELLAQIDDQVVRLVAEATKAKYDIARAKATNDVRIRYAQKAIEVAEAE